MAAQDDAERGKQWSQEDPIAMIMCDLQKTQVGVMAGDIGGGN